MQPTVAVKTVIKKIGAPSAAVKWKILRPPTAPRMVLKLPQGHEDSEYVLSFEIGRREDGFYSARTDGQTHSAPY